MSRFLCGRLCEDWESHQHLEPDNNHILDNNKVY